MRAVVQRVVDAKVKVGDELVGETGRGLLVYLGVGKGDGPGDASYLADKIAKLRIFEDGEGKMNLSLLDTGGGILAISQFTLYADARKGRRPSYSGAEDAEPARGLFEAFVADLSGLGIEVSTGRFQAEMAVSYTNLGPVTILLDSGKTF